MSIARSYAKALYLRWTELEPLKGGSETHSMPSELEAQMEVLLDLIESNRNLKIAMFGPVTSCNEKSAVIEALSKRLGLSRLLHHFLLLLARKGRLSLLPEIRVLFSTVSIQAQGGLLGNLVVAESVEPSEVESLSSAFSKKLNKKVVFKVSVDPHLIAGIRITVNGISYDGSLRAQIQRLKEQMMVGSVSGH